MGPDSTQILAGRIAASIALGLGGMYYLFLGRRDCSLKAMLWGGVLIVLAGLVF